MQKYIDAIPLYEHAAELEAKALEVIQKLRANPFLLTDQNEVKKWQMWSCILNERTAFKYDVMDAPAADVVERKKGKWIDDKGLYRCSACNHLWSELWWTSVVPANKMYKTMRFCPNCGAQMGERGEDDD